MPRRGQEQPQDGEVKIEFVLTQEEAGGLADALEFVGRLGDTPALERDHPAYEAAIAELPSRPSDQQRNLALAFGAAVRQQTQ